MQSQGIFNLAGGNYSQKINMPSDRTGVQLHVKFTGLNGANGTLNLKTGNDTDHLVAITHSELPATIASGTSSKVITIQGFAVADILEVVFTRNAVTAGTVEVLLSVVTT